MRRGGLTQGSQKDLEKLRVLHFPLLRSLRVVENLLETVRFTAFSARRQVAVSGKKKNERKHCGFFIS